MANIYARSTDGLDTDSGATWALAKATLAAAATASAAGGNIFVSQVHSESAAANVTITLAGTPNSPIRIICANDAAEPPTTSASSAVVGLAAGTYNLTLSGSCYVYGVQFSGSSGANNSFLYLNPYGTNANQKQTYENCTFTIQATSNTAICINNTAAAANATDGFIRFKNCGVATYSTTAPTFRVSGKFLWEGGSILAGQANSSQPLIVGVATTGRLADVRLSAVDLSNMGSSRYIFGNAQGIGVGVLRNCKLPTAWSGSLVTGALFVGNRLEMHNCDSGDTNYRLWVEEYAGTIRDETTVVRTGGASDGTTPLSWKMTTNTSASQITAVSSPEIARWNDTVGTPITATVEIVHDSQGAGTAGNFQNDEVWLDVQYLGTTGVPLGSFASDTKTDALATAADQPNSTATWTTTGLTTPVKQKLSVTFTPQKKGFILAQVRIGKASKTVYIDPLLTVA